MLGNVLDFPIYWICSFFIWGLIIFILIQMLIQFEIIPRHNQPARQVWSRLARFYNPILTPLRGVLPNIGGFDFAPLVLILGVYVLRSVLITLV